MTPNAPRYQDDVRLGARYFKPEDFDVAEMVEGMANEKGVKPAQIALAWLLHKPYITAPIIGVAKIEQLEEAVNALDVKLNAKEMEQLEQCYKPHTGGVW